MSQYTQILQFLNRLNTAFNLIVSNSKRIDELPAYVSGTKLAAIWNPNTQRTERVELNDNDGIPYSPMGTTRSFYVESDVNVTETTVRSLLNAGTPTGNYPISISSSETPVYIVINKTTETNTLRYVFGFSRGAGSWGFGGTTIPLFSFTQLSAPYYLTIDDITNDPNTQTIDLGSLPTGDYVTAANSESRDLSNEDLVYYFSYTQDGVLYLVQFIGDNGIYGSSGTQLVLGDFAAATNSNVTPEQDLQDVTTVGNTTNKDIIHTDESGTTYKNGAGDKQAFFRYVDEFNLEISDPTFKVINGSDSRYVPLNIGGVEADENGFVDISEGLSGQFIPLPGTTEGNPVAGDIEVADGIKIFTTDGVFRIGGETQGLQFSSDGVNNSAILSYPPTSKGFTGASEFTNDGSDRKQFPQNGWVLDNIAGREEITNDLFISCMLYKYIESPSTYDGRSMYYIYKGEEKYFDITPYVPDRSVFPRLLCHAVFIDGNNIIIQGSTGYNSADHNDMFILVFEDCYTLNGELKSSSYKYKTFVDFLNRDSSGLMYDVHGITLFDGYLYGNTRIQQAGITAGARTQVFKINPYDLEDATVITLNDYQGSAGEIQVTKDGVFSVVVRSATLGGYIIRTDLNLNNVTNLADIGTTITKRVLRSVPFVISKGELYLPTYDNTSSSTYPRFLKVSVYNTLSGKLVRESETLTISPGTEINDLYWHWANIYQGKLIMHACIGNNENRYIVRIDTATLTLEESRPVSFFSGSNSTIFTNDNSIMPDGYIYFNEELNAVTGKLYRVKYNDFSDFTAITPIGNGGYYYSGGSTDTRFGKDYQSKSLQKVLESTTPNLTAPTSTGTLTTGVRVNSVTYTTGTDGIADLGTIGGTSTVYPKILICDVTPATVQGSVSGSTETIFRLEPIPANTLSAGVLSVNFTFSNVGVAGTKPIKCYLSNSSSMVSSNVYAILTPSATGRFNRITRDLIISSSGLVTGAANGASLPTDQIINGGAKRAATTLDFTQTIYVYATVALTSTADDMTQEAVEVLFIKAQ